MFPPCVTPTFRFLSLSAHFRPLSASPSCSSWRAGSRLLVASCRPLSLLAFGNADFRASKCVGAPIQFAVPVASPVGHVKCSQTAILGSARGQGGTPRALWRSGLGPRTPVREELVSHPPPSETDVLARPKCQGWRHVTDPGWSLSCFPRAQRPSAQGQWEGQDNEVHFTQKVWVIASHEPTLLWVFFFPSCYVICD